MAMHILFRAVLDKMLHATIIESPGHEYPQKPQNDD